MRSDTLAWLLGLLVIFLLYFNIVRAEETRREDIKNERDPKFWPIGLVRFANSVCTSLEGYQGTCYTSRQCSDIDGASSGTCSSIGTCCLIMRTCGDSSSYNNTYFTNDGYPSTYNGGTLCTFTIIPCNSDICQVRIDLLSFTLAQPDGNGNCVFDSMTVTGSASSIPIICGDNSGQHMYLSFNGNASIVISIATSASVALERSWNIKVTQIACACPTLAPAGCLQYYQTLSGSVRSFNYGTTLNGALVTLDNGTILAGTRQIANTNYGVCVQMVPGYCSIEWSQGSDDTSFTVTNDTALVAADTGLPASGIIGENCTSDFVVIPNPYYVNGTAVNADRFCGNAFPTVITSSKPFVLTVVTNGDELTDQANRGFNLNFEQLPCGNLGTFLIT